MNTQFRWFYSVNDVGQKTPSVCVCLYEAEGYSGLGLAICSRSDNPCYKTGRGIALARAQYAMRCDRPELLINRTEALEVVAGVLYPPAPVFDRKSVPSGTDGFQNMLDVIWPPREKGAHDSVRGQ